MGEGLLSETDVADKLLATAGAIGLKDSEALATIRSGLAAGKKEGRPGLRTKAAARPAASYSSNGDHDPTEDSEEQDSSMIDRGKHDLGNAVYAHHLYGERFIYTDGLGWVYWTGTHWAGDTAEAKVHGAVVKALKQRCTMALQSDDVDLLPHGHPQRKAHPRCSLSLQAPGDRQ